MPVRLTVDDIVLKEMFGLDATRFTRPKREGARILLVGILQKKLPAPYFPHTVYCGELLLHISTYLRECGVTSAALMQSPHDHSTYYSLLAVPSRLLTTCSSTLHHLPCITAGRLGRSCWHARMISRSILYYSLPVIVFRRK